MPQVHVKKSKAKKILVLAIVLLLFLGMIGGISFWESKQRQEAMLVQSEIDESARRRREGWVNRDGVWYAPKENQETVLMIGLDKTEPIEASESYNNNAQADFCFWQSLMRPRKPQPFSTLTVIRWQKSRYWV